MGETWKIYSSSEVTVNLPGFPGKELEEGRFTISGKLEKIFQVSRQKESKEGEEIG